MMKASLSTQPKDRVAVWNRIFFQNHPTLNASIDELTSFITKLLEAFCQSLSELKVEGLIFKSRLVNIVAPKGFDIYLIEVQNENFKKPEIFVKILGNQQNFYDTTLPLTKNDQRAQQITARGGVWRHRIPQL